MEFVEIKKISSWPWEFELYISYEVKWKIPYNFDAQAKVKIFSSFSCVHSEESEVYYNVEKKITFLVLTITLWIGWVFILLYKNNNKIKTNKTATKTEASMLPMSQVWSAVAKAWAFISMEAWI